MYIWSSVHECFAAAGSIALQKLVSNNSSSTIEIASSESLLIKLNANFGSTGVVTSLL